MFGIFVCVNYNKIRRHDRLRQPIEYKKMGESKRFSLMLGEAIGNVIPNKKIKLCAAV